MRLKFGESIRIVLVEGTTFTGTVRFSWRFRTVKLVNVITQSRDGEIHADGYLLIPVRSILFAQVGGA
jgi:hypothetical protein